MYPLMKKNSCNSLRPAYDRFFDDMFNTAFPSLFFGDPMPRKLMRSVPTANISETDEAFQIELAAPGYEKEDLKLSLEDKGRTLVVKAEINKDENADETAEKKHNLFHREHYYSSFERSFSLPENVDAEKISAAYKRGVLRINLPKKQAVEETASQSISIE